MTWRIIVSTSHVSTSRGPGCLIQLLWFIFIGWWLGQAAVALAFFLMVTIIGIPVGIIIVNNLPLIVALRQPPENLRITTTADGRAIVAGAGRPQLPFILRALWFVVFGWWLTGLWIEAAYLLCITVIGLPLGFWMFDKAPAILTLRQG